MARFADIVRTGMGSGDQVKDVQPPPHPAGVGGAVMHRRGLHEPAGRGTAQHLDGDGANARIEHPRQAGDAEPLGGRGEVPPAALGPVGRAPPYG